MSILVVGSIALDTVETPYGMADNALGGSALYFSAAASFFSPVNLVGVVGTDFDISKVQFLKEKQINFDGLAVEEGSTFRWGGKYHKDVNHRDTLFTELNVFKNFKPVIPPHYRNDDYIFLANIDPELQMDVLEQMTKPKLVVLDTMNFWINGKRDAILALIKKIDILIINDEELFDLTGIHHIYEAAKSLLKKGPESLVIKKGGHGAVLINKHGYFLAPAYPVDKVVDPTGAGDSFAGGFLGYLSFCQKPDEMALRRAIIYGTVTASFVVEDFSFNRLAQVAEEDIETRLNILRYMTIF